MVAVNLSRLPRLIAPLLLASAIAYALSDGLQWVSRAVAVPARLFLSVKLQQAGVV